MSLSVHSVIFTKAYYYIMVIEGLIKIFSVIASI